MVYCRMDGKETDSQRDEEYEAEIVDADFGSVYFLWICGNQKYTGVPVWMSQIKSAIFFVTEKDGTF